MKKEIDYNKIHSFNELLDAKYGNQGTKERDVWEQEYEAFKMRIIRLGLGANLHMYID